MLLFHQMEKNVIVLFPEGDARILWSSGILSESKSESIQFTSIAKIICSKMFQNELKCKGPPEGFSHRLLIFL